MAPGVFVGPFHGQRGYLGSRQPERVGNKPQLALQRQLRERWRAGLMREEGKMGQARGGWSHPPKNPSGLKGGSVGLRLLTGRPHERHRQLRAYPGQIRASFYLPWACLQAEVLLGWNLPPWGPGTPHNWEGVFQLRKTSSAWKQGNG